MGLLATQPRAGLLNRNSGSSQKDPVDSFLFSLGQKESSGNYSALGPVIKSGSYKGDRAYGKYQVMGKNVPSWTKQYLGVSMTPQQFLSDTQSQDKLMRARASELYNKYGNWEDVASVHFSGRPLAKAGNASDQLGTTTPNYVKDVVKGLPAAAAQVGKWIGKNVLVPMGQGALRVNAALGNALTAGTGKPLTPTTQFQKDLYGTDKPITFRSVGSELGVSEQGKYAAPLGLALGISDLIPGGKITKTTAVGLLKNANKVDDVVKILTKMMGVSQDVATKYAPKAAQLTDAKQLSTLVDDVVRESQSVGRLAQKGKQVVSGLLKSTDPLTLEARKYKSAEEFVKAQGQTVYRGGKKLDVSKINDEGLPVTFDNKVAEQFARSKNQFAESPAGQIMGYQKGQNVVETYHISPNAKIATKANIPEEVYNAYKQANPLTKPDVAEPIVVKWAKANGFDAIDFRTLGKTSAKEAEIKVITPDVLKTKSQLTDIWERANKGRNTLSQAPAGQTTPQPRGRIAKPPTPAQQALEPYLKESLSYSDDIPKTVDKSIPVKPTNYKLNVDNFDVPTVAKETIAKEIGDLKPYLETKIGGRLTNKEVRELAEQSSNILKKEVGVEQTKNWIVASDNLRASIAKAAKEGRVDKEFIENIKIDKTVGTDIARKLQARSMEVEARSPQEQLISAILDSNDNADEILKAAQGVNFDNFDEATAFYRKFVAPKAQEWIDLLRYNSMLSSPLTHIVNTFSNLVNSIAVAPIEKAIAGGVDFLGGLAGKERTQFAGESAVFLKNYFTKIGSASNRFLDVISGKRSMTNLDTRQIPLAKGGVKGAAVSTLSFPMRLLDASDQFFTELTQAAETAALTYRETKGVKVANLSVQAGEKASYRLFRQDLFPDEQGMVLDAVDQFTSMVMQLRNSKNPIVSTVARFTVPFIKTPMNIFKQGIEYSPAGITTLVGSKNKTLQLSKAIIGSTVFTGAAIMLSSDRLTWSEPTNETTKNLWRQAGKQPYSVKIGDKWWSYQKLPPALGFPLAMTAAIDDARKNAKMDDTTTDLVLSSIAKWGEFLADQSYAKSIGDLLTSVKGGESGIARVISNYPQQLVPFRALTGWMAKLSDDVQRKPDPEGTFVDKQIQLLMMNYPGLSQKVPARENSTGEAIPNRNKWWNALSPVRMQQEVSEFKSFLDNYEKYASLTRQENEKSTQLKETATSLYEEYKALSPEEANAKAKALKESDPRVYSRLKDVVEENKYSYTQEEKYIKSLGVENGLRANYIWDELSDMATPEEKNAYIKLLREKKIITSDVFKQLKELRQ